ncbi:MAG: hypothetical protein RBG13Loki_0224 [Promethearchaeota archaeon CR_4]|nr:MAG: hypothetical protein RBG13Loki_0224 [Candidatus Lokiarchaeota archaeon CR_4]
MKLFNYRLNWGKNVIADNIANWRAVTANLPNKFSIAFAWIEAHMQSALATGRYVLGDGVFALVQVNRLRPLRRGRFENHRKYIDIQFSITGRERIFWTKPKPVKQLEAYNEEKDIEIFEVEDPLTMSSSILLEPGIFVILAPSDWYMSGIAPEGKPAEELEKSTTPEFIQKIVMKVAVD